MGFTDLWMRLRALASRSRAESELDEELEFHLAMEARKRAGGSPANDARLRARAAFGGLEQVREQCRDVRGLTVLENLAKDFLYGFRVLRKTPLFTIVAVLSLAVGIGANTAMFTLVDYVLLRLLPVRSAEELVLLKWSARRRPKDLNTSNSSNDGGTGNFRTNVLSWQIFQEMRARSSRLAAFFGYAPLAQLNVAANGEARMTGGMAVTGNFFSGLGVDLELGRAIADDDDTASGQPAVVISYRLWERAFSFDPKVVGKNLYINRQPFTVVGVTRRSYFGVSAGGFWTTPEVDVTVPIRARPLLALIPGRSIPWFEGDMFWMQAMGRLRPGGDPRAAEAELTPLLASGMPQTVANDPKAGPPRVELSYGGQGWDFLRRRFQEPLLILSAVTAIVLLMTCANLAGLLLAKATARRREMAVRLAIGASRWRLVRQLLIEGAMLAAAGAAGGLLLARWGVGGLVTLVGPNGFAFDVRPDARVLAFTATISLVTTLLFALAPALRATRPDVAAGLKIDNPLAAGHNRFRPVRALLTAQIAAALVLVAGATLFTRSLINLRSIPVGFNARKLVLFGVMPGANGYNETRGSLFYPALAERLRRIPGVTGVTLSSQTPLDGGSSNTEIRVAGDTSRRRTMSLNFVGPDFLEVMEIPLLMGRSIGPGDTASSPRVAVISETAARRYFQGGSPLGRKFYWPGRQDMEVEVVGVAQDAKYDYLKKAPEEVAYVPYTQCQYGWLPAMSYELRTAADTASTIAGARAAVREMDAMLPVMRVHTMEGQIDEALGQERLFAGLVSLFGSITLVLACVGLYGLVSFSVTSRTREIGVRMALGAGRTAVLRMMLGQVAAASAIGLLAGIPATLALTRFVASQLYGLKPNDPLSLAVSAVAVVLVGMLAAWLPARRAVKIDPLHALRYE